ncbi:DUF4167 domain-containing protein [Sphingomonas sp. HDW15A]|uniref:DUF4167 domain-containing protein n=1 Tax=Sphingomonas sp. HDW15A TaxID=2714942 RepID=UPI00140A94AC|nr:DUF4167 domain-containing protein [Sphingomonas sp. HDW15A]QIK97057.1 DUF4167 domain-containing protein [Sphingomonas sp. HDW15A]
MINNRQSGRRRGRGGQRPQGMPGNSGNARDNRQRGNAAQLLEKYKNMARDAQLAGDRVQTEYFLQFADHYFRVLSESRVRFEEQRRQRGDDDSDDDGDELIESEAESGVENEDRQPRRRARDRDERPERSERTERQPRGNGRTPATADDDDHRMPFDALPPAIARDENDELSEEDETPPARPVRRTRRAKSVDDGEGAVA